MEREKSTLVVETPTMWSNHMRRWDNGDWQSQPREWKKNEGWRALREGSVSGHYKAI